MMHGEKKIYLFHDTVHLAKNVRNNLLNYIRFLLPEAPRRFYEQDTLLQSYVRKAPKITPKVLHPGSCKQDVPTALAIFHETTSAAIEDFFPERKDAAEFLRLLSQSGGF